MEMLLSEIDTSPLPEDDPPASLQQNERQQIVKALEQAHFNQRKAAKLLQVHRATLARKLKQHKLD